MASEPTVVCVMLTKDRPAMAARAVASFRAQTYERKRLLIVDSNPNACSRQILARDTDLDEWPIEAQPDFAFRGAETIGQLRNLACRYAAHHYVRSRDCVEVFAHWDDDDWSHPNRLAEQVALLQASGADLVGYSEALFWDTRTYVDVTSDPMRITKLADRLSDKFSNPDGQAWLYRNPDPAYALGTSFCYWRRVWEAHPFDHINHGEDERFRAKVACMGISSIGRQPLVGEPRMIASIHGSNTSPFDPAKTPAMCRRVPTWDSYCAERTRL